jgi:hypothetical protein
MSIVLPNGYANSPGMSAGTVFGPQGLSLPPPSFRHQAIYSSSMFPGAGTITSIAFRIVSTNYIGSPQSSSFSNISYNLKINLGYSANRVGSGSLTFANNVGSNSTTIIDSTSVTKSATGGSVVNPFDISFTCSFTYDPSVGDLLLDIFMRNSVGQAYTDAVDTSSNPLIQRMETIQDNTSNVNSATATGGTDYVGLVTQFGGIDVTSQPLTATQMSPQGRPLLAPGLRMLNKF